MPYSCWRLPVAGGFIGGITNDGTGRDVLLVPGVGSSSMSWSTLIGQLSDFRVTALDLRGHAQSVDAPLLDADQGWRDVIGVIEGRALDRPVLVGHGTGGFLALAAAADRPDLASSVVTIEAALMDGPRETVHLALQEVYSEEMIDTIAARFGFGHVYGSRQEVEDAIAAGRPNVARDWLLSEVPADLGDELRYAIVERPDGSWLFTPDRAAMRAGYTLRTDAAYYPHADLYTQVHVPIHVVQASEGLSVVPADQAERLESQLPHLQFHDVPGGYLVHRSHAPDLARILRSVAAEAGTRSAA